MARNKPPEFGTLEHAYFAPAPIVPNDPEHVIKFFRCLRLPEGAAGGRLWEPMSWHKDVIRRIFGNTDSDGFRRVREFYCSIPRKNSKTVFAAGLALYFLIMDGENSPGVYMVANSIEQAKICFRAVHYMATTHRLINAMCRPVPSRGEIYVPANNGRLKVLSKMPGTAHGLSCSFCVYDELHEARSGELYDVMLTSMGARRQPLMISITTAGNSKNSIAFQKYDYCKKVLSGQIEDPAFSGYIREPAPGQKWNDPETWKAVNPGWGISVYPAALEALAKQAENVPSAEATFRQLYLNEWLSASRKWISSSVWQKTRTGARLEDFSGAEFYGGLDLSSTQDLTAFVLACRDGDFSYLFPFFFLPSETIETHPANKNIYSAALRRGDLQQIVGNVIDYDYIVSFIRALGRRVNIRGIAFDPWNSVHPVAQLAADFDMIRFPQSYAAISPASKDFERALIAGSLLHADNSLLNFCAENAEIKNDSNGNIKPVKASDAAKIDGIIAAIMAFDLLQKNNVSSVYETRGLISI